MLQARNQEITPEVLALMGELATRLVERADDPESAETAKRLRDIRAQAMLLV